MGLEKLSMNLSSRLEFAVGSDLSNRSDLKSGRGQELRARKDPWVEDKTRSPQFATGLVPGLPAILAPKCILHARPSPLRCPLGLYSTPLRVKLKSL